MELPVTTQGNRYVIVFQDLFTKWPMVFPTPDQKSERIACLLVEEIIPYFGVPEAVLSDRGTNLLSFLMKDICQLLGIKKLNTTASHHNATEWLRDLIEHSNQCSGNKQLNLECNGISILVESCRHTVTRHTVLQVKSHQYHFYYLGLTVDLLQKLLYCLPSHLELPMPMYLIIKSRWYYHCHLLGAWRLRPVKKLSDDTKYNMTKQQELQSSELAIGR